MTTTTTTLTREQHATVESAVFLAFIVLGAGRVRVIHSTRDTRTDQPRPTQ